MAGLLAAFSAVVIYGSLQLNSGWSSTGPEAGYFPLRLSVLLLIVSVLLLIQAVRKPVQDEVFVTGEQLRRVMSLFIPTVVLAAAAPFLGFYVASAVFLVYMCRLHGHFGWGRSLLIGVGAVVVLYAIFELWFNVPLARGPLEDWIDTWRLAA
ncbi:tripartite tricarboxylate transporter TctB family protein [Bordetella muralis]